MKEYRVSSPLLDILVGVGRSEKEARDSFNIFLNDLYIDYLEGKKVGRYRKRGRPSKRVEEWHITVKPQTKKDVGALAKNLGTSQGEVVDYLIGFWRAHPEAMESTTKSGSARPAKTARKKARNKKSAGTRKVG